MSKIKFGVCEFCFPFWGPQAIQMASEAGFSGMQLADGGGALYSFPMNNKWIQDSYLENAAKYGIVLQSMHLYTLARQELIKCSPNSPEGEECKKSIKMGIIAASQMGIPAVMIEGMRMYGAAQKQHVFDMYEYAVDVADGYGVQITMETDMSLEDHFRYTDAFGGRLKLCFDAHNPVMYGTGYPPDMIRALGRDRIYHFHIKDAVPDEEGFITKATSPIVLLGEGGTYFKESVQAIKDIGFEGWLMSETFYTRPNLNENGPDYIALAAKDVQTLKDAFGDY